MPALFVYRSAVQVKEIVPAWANCNGVMIRTEKINMTLIVSCIFWFMGFILLPSCFLLKQGQFSFKACLEFKNMANPDISAVNDI